MSASPAAVEAIQTAWIEHTQDGDFWDFENPRRRRCGCGVEFDLWSLWVEHRWQAIADAAVNAPSGEAAEPTTHEHRYERFSRVVEACCDSMHYFCDCGAKEPCADAEPTATDRDE